MMDKVKLRILSGLVKVEYNGITFYTRDAALRLNKHITTTEEAIDIEIDDRLEVISDTYYDPRNKDHIRIIVKDDAHYLTVVDIKLWLVEIDIEVQEIWYKGDIEKDQGIVTVRDKVTGEYIEIPEDIYSEIIMEEQWINK